MSPPALSTSVDCLSRANLSPVADAIKQILLVLCKKT